MKHCSERVLTLCCNLQGRCHHPGARWRHGRGRARARDRDCGIKNAGLLCTPPPRLRQQQEHCSLSLRCHPSHRWPSSPQLHYPKGCLWNETEGGSARFPLPPGDSELCREGSYSSFFGSCTHRLHGMSVWDTFVNGHEFAH